MTPIFRSMILQNIAFFFLLQFCIPVFVSYNQWKCLLGRGMEGFSTVCICKPPENTVFWIVFCYRVHCIIKQKAARKEILEQSTPIQSSFTCKSVQEDLSFLMCWVWSARWRWLPLNSLTVQTLSHHDSIYSSHLHVHYGYFLERSRFSCSENTCCHFLSFSFCQISVASSFKSCLENGNRLVITF